MDEFNPAPVMIIESPEQIKAFTDPLRVKVLRILAERAATNQQIADLLGQPHAKVLYHIRFLVDVGLIKLVDTQIKGGNVEKYYRALANIFDLRPPPSHFSFRVCWASLARPAGNVLIALETSHQPHHTPAASTTSGHRRQAR